jgi:Mg2+/Co2+ transporter CorB
MAEIREIKVAFNDYRADLTIDVGFVGNIPMDVPLLALPEVVNITITNSLSDGTAIAYYRNADNNDATQVLYANTVLTVLKNTKVSIGRANPTLYNITNIKVTSQDGTLLKDTNANLFDLENAIVDDVMTAHTHIEDIDLDTPFEELTQQISASNHTRLLVKQGANEEIVGVIHIRKVINLLRNGELTIEGLKDIIDDPYFIPSGTPLYTQIQQFQEKHERLALVVDEYGELKGLVTLEDILEEIIGDFTTQSPLRANTYHQEEDGSWLVDGSSNLRDLNKKLNLELPLDGPRTLNGLILEHFEDIPEAGTSIKIANCALEIVQTQDKIVKSVRLLVLNSNSDQDE